MPKTKLMQDAKKAEAYSQRVKKEMQSAREENSKIRESKDKAKTKVMQSEREGNAKIYGYKKGGLVKSGKPKIATKGWR